MRSYFAGLCLVLSFAAPLAALAVDAASFQEVEESLTCQCGCGLTVHSCNHTSCDSAIPLRAEIRGKVDNGESKEQIVKEFADKYGEKILSSPTTTGFNILAWVMPFIVVGTAIALVLLIVARWGRRPGPPRSPEAPSSPRARSAHEQIMDRELKSFDS